MNAPRLVRYLAKELECADYRAGWTLRAFVQVVRGALGRGEVVTISGLGTLRVKRCGSRVVYDFKGTPQVTPGRKVSFRPSKSLRSLLT